MEALEEDCPTTRNRMLLGVGVCLSAQFLAAGASYWGMKAPLKAKQTRLETRLEKFVNADKQNRLTQRLVKFVNADIAPPPKMSLEMAIDLEGGASWLMTKAQFNQFVKGKPTVGRPDGQFVTSARQMNRVMSESGGDSQKLGELLGVPEWTTNTELVRVDVVNPTRYNPRLPNASMSGANSEFVAGGATSGGVPEVVIDQLPAVEIWATPVKRCGTN